MALIDQSSGRFVAKALAMRMAPGSAVMRFSICRDRGTDEMLFVDPNTPSRNSPNQTSRNVVRKSARSAKFSDPVVTTAGRQLPGHAVTPPPPATARSSDGRAVVR